MPLALYAETSLELPCHQICQFCKSVVKPPPERPRPTSDLLTESTYKFLGPARTLVLYLVVIIHTTASLRFTSRNLNMELMELVDNEPMTRPFQCDWQSCDKVGFTAPR